MKNTDHKINRHLRDMFEKVTIQEFLREKKLFEGSDITYPNPPDCVVTAPNGKILWIEESVGIYKKWKRQIAVNHYEYECLNNGDNYQLEGIQKLIDSINKKDNNPKYKVFTKKYGKGILLLRIDDPCFQWPRDLNRIINPDHYKNIKLNRFHAVYLYNRPLVVQQKSSEPVVWESQVLPGCPNFFLLYGQDVEESK